MSINKLASLKLESFFIAQDLMKTASLSNFEDVHSEDELRTLYPMLHKMIMLPKYDKLKQQLKFANGLVNFVTYDEYEPLVEMLFKIAIPPASNDMYHMGQEFTLQEDYFVDAKGMFGPQQATSAKAFDQMEQIIRGMPKKMTRKWLKSQGLDPDEKAVGGKQTSFEQAFSDVVLIPNPNDKENPQKIIRSELIKKSLEAYAKAKAELLKSQLRSDIDRLFKKLDRDRLNKSTIPEIEKFNAGKPDAMKADIPETLSAEELTSLRRQLRLKRDRYAKQLQVIESAFPALELEPDAYTYTSEVGDGFLSWSPGQDIASIYDDFKKTCVETPSESFDAAMPEIERKIINLKSHLADYRTTDPDLIKKRDMLIDFLTAAQEENSAVAYKTLSNLGTFGHLFGEFSDRISEHGKVMIFDNVDNSALTTAPATAGRPDEKNKGPVLGNHGVLSDFAASNNAGISRSVEQDARQRSGQGKKTIILISTYPLSGLPKGSSQFGMDISPVDEKEAEIIVNAIVDSFVKSAQSLASLKMLSDVDKKYENATSQKQLSQKEVEEHQVGQAIAMRKNTIAYISPEGRQDIMQMIIGKGQKEAILAVKQILSMYAIYEKDENGLKTNIVFDEERLVKDMADDFTEKLSTNVPGLQINKKYKCTFPHYITKRGSEWASVVGNIAAGAQSYVFYNNCIDETRKLISKTEYELTSASISPQLRMDKSKTIELLQNDLEGYVLKRNASRESISHFTILRGSPGSGKSIWGHALAELFHFKVGYAKLEDTFSKWVGDSPKNVDKLVEAIFNSRNIVYIFDEIDRALGGGGSGSGTDSSGGGRGDDTHQTVKQALSKMLMAFGDRIPELIKRNVYVVMTTNHLNAIDNAMVSRAIGKGDVQEVQSSDDPEDFLKFLQTFMEEERKEEADYPWIRLGGHTTEQMWDYTIKYVKENVDLRKVAEAFAAKNLSYRALGGVIKRACVLHNSYMNEFLYPLARGEVVKPTGMVMNTTTLLRSAAYAEDDPKDATKKSTGVDKVHAEVVRVASDAWKNVKLEEYTEINPITKKPETKYRVPSDFAEIMEGKVLPKEETQEDIPGVTEEDIPSPLDPSQSGKRKRVFFQGPQQGIKDLPYSGMKEEPLTSPNAQQGLENVQGPPIGQEKSDPSKKGKPSKTEKDKENEKAQGKASSTSEYLYRYLVSKGVISEKGVVVSQSLQNNQNGIQTGNNTPAGKPFDEFEQYGTYYFNDRQICVLSEEGVPPLTFYNSKRRY